MAAASTTSRLFLLSSLDLPDVRALVDRMAEASDAEVVQLTGAVEAIERETVPGAAPGYARFAAEFGRRYFELQRDWARWVLRELEHHVEVQPPPEERSE